MASLSRPIRTGGESMAKRVRARSAVGMIDDYVAGRIRERRIMLGVTQQHFAEMIGVSLINTSAASVASGPGDYLRLPAR